MPRYVTNSMLISLLAEHGVKHVVLSSGARNIPFVSAIETDERFHCYSVVDERNAAFFALGISQQLDEPVAIACTSGTAASNYLTGVTEAFYAHTPLVVLTFDRSPYLLGQIETQKIDQPAIFQSVVKKSVTLPLINRYTEYSCGRECSSRCCRKCERDGLYCAGHGFQVQGLFRQTKGEKGSYCYGTVSSTFDRNAESHPYFL